MARIVNRNVNLSYIMTLLFDKDSVYLKHVINIVITEHKSLEASKKKRKQLANASNVVPSGNTKREAGTNTAVTVVNQDDLIDRAKEYIAQEMHKASFGIIKRISDAVGSQYLSRTYDAVRGQKRVS